jgi:hypothetical protein
VGQIAHYGNLAGLTATLFLLREFEKEKAIRDCERPFMTRIQCHIETIEL